MKKLEKNEMRHIQGGEASAKVCQDNGDGTSSCLYCTASKCCYGEYTYGGAELLMVCSD